MTSKFKELSPLAAGLAAALAAALIYEHGLLSGARSFFALAAFYVLFRSSLSIAMGFMLHGELLGRLDKLLLAIPVAYLIASFAFSWPGLAFIFILGPAAGAVVGLISAVASPCYRSR